MNRVYTIVPLECAKADVHRGSRMIYLQGKLSDLSHPWKALNIQF